MDVIVVYKIDRLTRSLFDFSKIVEIFEEGGASFVSVTQQFNTTTSMGRLTLNVLLSFAQFEREVTGERIRDKIAASKKKGMWMGGFVPLGYQVVNRELLIEEDEAQTVQQLYDLYIDLGTVKAVKAKADSLGMNIRPKDNKEPSLFSRGYIHRILTNPIYIGKIPHKKLIHEGLHKAIISLEKWNKVQLMLQDSVGRERDQPSATEPSPLAGKLFEASGERLTPSHAVKAGKRYRYYISNSLIQDGKNPSGIRISAPEVEGAVCNLIREFLITEQNMATLINDQNPNPSELIAFVDHAQEYAIKLEKQSPYAQLAKLKTVVEKIDISASNLTVTLRAAIFVDLIRKHSLKTALTTNNEEPVKLHTITKPMRLGRRGRETRLILNNSSTAQRPVDTSLLSCIARGYAWRHEIVTGQSKSSVEIARRENVTPSFVSRLIDVSFLAPGILAAIADGRSPVDLTANKLLYTTNIPLDWPSQRYVLGFNS